jgi:hypothetical protein
MPIMKKLAVVTCVGIGMYLSARVVLRADSMSQVQSSSYFGNYGYDEATDAAVDGSGFVYVVGSSEAFGGNADTFVLKLTPDGSQVVYSRYFRGSGFDIANAVAVDGTGAAKQPKASVRTTTNALVFDREQESLRVETRYDNARSEFLVVVGYPDGSERTERFATLEDFRRT